MFDYKIIIGRGAFGKVWKVQLKKYKIDYALKEMCKKKIIDRKSESLIMYERDLLVKMNHPFISNLKFAFQDEDKLYLVMDLITGGDLRFHLYKNKKFNEAQTKFFIACVILSLEYLHKNKIIHHDIKPENLILNSKGYVKLTDFGIARIYRPNNSEDISGSPGYIAPEILCEENHTYASDYFSLGILTYELMKGDRPYLGKSRREIKEKILKHEFIMTKKDLPEGWSIDCADFINKLLKRQQHLRLGFRGIEEIKGHSWLKYYNWKDLYLEKIVAPFIPSPNIENNYNVRYCNMVEKIGIDTQERYKIIQQHSYYSEAFTKFLNFNRYASEANSSNEINMLTNPHAIYSILEEKEQMAFETRDSKKDKNNKHQRRAVSLTDGRYRSILSNNYNTQESTNKDSNGANKVTANEKHHRKNVYSLIRPIIMKK